VSRKLNLTAAANAMSSAVGSLSERQGMSEETEMTSFKSSLRRLRDISGLNCAKREGGREGSSCVSLSLSTLWAVRASSTQAMIDKCIFVLKRRMSCSLMSDGGVEG
jgi:hypothetical protein